MSRRKITILGIGQAREGFRFIFEGSPEPCRHCEFFNACSGRLEPGRIYKVISVKERNLPCRLHGGGAKVVEVEESCIEASLERRLAVEGALISYNPIECGRENCGQKVLCRPLGLRAGD
ncbi:MAG: UPF0179 family protein, partial [Candidatus Bathyarchaeia archaeon]